jgi:hypothetical protein
MRSIFRLSVRKKRRRALLSEKQFPIGEKEMKRMALAILATSAVLAPGAFAQDAGSAKGIYRDPAATPTKNGVAYRVLLLRGDERREVPVSFGFRSGDRFKLQVNLKDAAYVYVLNRTFSGDPKEIGDKGMTTVRDEDRTNPDRSRPSYTLLFPASGERPEKIAAGKYRDIPGDVALRMDQTPGVEKVYVIVSDHQLDLPKMFAGGRLRNGGSRTATDSDSHKSDSEDDVLDRLNKELTEWASDSQTEGPPAGTEDSTGKGIERDTYTVGARAKPILAEISLRHYRD